MGGKKPEDGKVERKPRPETIFRRTAKRKFDAWWELHGKALANGDLDQRVKLHAAFCAGLAMDAMG